MGYIADELTQILTYEWQAVAGLQFISFNLAPFHEVDYF